MKKRENKKGLSPVIATILLVGIVVAIGLIVFLWIRGFVKEEGMKSIAGVSKNVRLVCGDVQFDATYENGNLNIQNTGNVPIFRIDIKEYTGSGFTTLHVTSDKYAGWSKVGLNQGGTFSGDIGSISGVTKMVVIPILVSQTGKGKEIYTCEEQYGISVSV